MSWTYHVKPIKSLVTRDCSLFVTGTILLYLPYMKLTHTHTYTHTCRVTERHTHMILCFSFLTLVLQHWRVIKVEKSWRTFAVELHREDQVPGDASESRQCNSLANWLSINHDMLYQNFHRIPHCNYWQSFLSRSPLRGKEKNVLSSFIILSREHLKLLLILCRTRFSLVFLNFVENSYTKRIIAMIARDGKRKRTCC